VASAVSMYAETLGEVEGTRSLAVTLAWMGTVVSVRAVPVPPIVCRSVVSNFAAQNRMRDLESGWEHTELWIESLQIVAK
jgi:hypothetical protein